MIRGICPAGRSSIGYESISLRVTTVDPVDDEEMEDKQGGNEVPPVARRFLERHRPVGNALGSTGRDTSEGNDDDDDDDDDNEARDQGEADGELEIEGPGVDGVPVVAVCVNPEVPALPAQLFAPRPRAKGVAHPPVPTRAQVERHALEQHVNYAPWCPH